MFKNKVDSALEQAMRDEFGSHRETVHYVNLDTIDYKVMITARMSLLSNKQYHFSGFRVVIVRVADNSVTDIPVEYSDFDSARGEANRWAGIVDTAARED